MTVLDATRGTSRPRVEHSIELDAHERAEFNALAEQLVRTAPGLIDDPDWLAAARQLSCRLPVRLRQAIRRYRHDPGRSGTLLLAGLPIDEHGLPDTPDVRESVEREAAGPAAVAMLIGQQMGEVVAYRDEKSGALVQNVVPVKGLEDSQSNAGSTPLEFHIENAFHPHRPDYVGLLCLRGDHSSTAGTLVSSIRNAVPLLDGADREVLLQPRFRTAAPPSFHSGDARPAHPVLAGSPEDPDVCLDFNATEPLDDEADAVLQRLRKVLFDVAVSLVLGPGEMAFVDNRLVLHGRSQFTPRYDGRDRWLHRVYVHTDNRRTRAHRPSGGQVLL
ncbi:TauD/TfdA family dioxygenase [Dactylosporangium sp. CA-233914]|uniref:TauD/TfdA family dioxygenase n=1 Tax=Dactylosporangium sp. CA-233914 TaxID=3239934 RepID=UPI003D920D20